MRERGEDEEDKGGCEGARTEEHPESEAQQALGPRTSVYLAFLADLIDEERRGKEAGGSG